MASTIKTHHEKASFIRYYLPSGRWLPKKDKDIAPAPASTCQLESFTDMYGRKTEINRLDTVGRVAQVTVNPAQGQVLTTVSTFVYDNNGQLKSSTQTFSEKGRQLFSQPTAYSYKNSLLTTVENHCGCAQNVVGQR